MARKAADGAIATTKRALIEQAAKHGRQLVLIDPKYTTTDCGKCGARAKHRLPLSQRIYRCEHCGHVAPRDENSAHVILNRAGFNPAGADGIRPERSPSEQAAWARNPAHSWAGGFKLADLEDMTSAWVSWYNTSRPMHPLGRRPPAEAEAQYYDQPQIGKHTDHT